MPHRSQVHPQSHWVEAFDHSSQQPYYFNYVTGEAIWEKPAEYHPQEVVIKHAPSPDEVQNRRQTGDTDVNDMTPCFSCCCVIMSCYLLFPDCCGCATNVDMCCLGAELYACKTSRNPASYCQCIKAEVDCNPPLACVMVRGQTCCLDIRCSIPCSEQIPCLLTMCFWTCCYRDSMTCACCEKIAKLPRPSQ